MMKLRLREYIMELAQGHIVTPRQINGSEYKSVSLQISAHNSTSINAEPLPSSLSPGVCPGLMSVPVSLQCPTQGSCPASPSQPDHFLLVSQPEKARMNADLRQGLIGASAAPAQPTRLLTETFGQEPGTDKGRMDQQPAAGPRGGQPGAYSRRREGPLFSPLKGGLRKAGSVIFPRSLSRAREWEHLCPELCSGCGSGHSLGLTSAGDSPAWRRFWLAGRWGGAGGCRSGWPADEGSRWPPPQETGSPGQAGEQGWGGRLGRQGPSPLTVQKRWGDSGIRAGGPGATAPLPQASRPKAPSFPFCLSR